MKKEIFEELRKHVLELAKKLEDETSFLKNKKEPRSLKPDFRILSDRNLIYEFETTSTEKLGSLVLPETALSGKVKYGIVLFSGPGYHAQSGHLVENDLRPGDVVILPPHANNQEIKFGNTTYQVYRTPEIIARVFRINLSDIV